MASVRTERTGDVLQVVLDRPERRNAFDGTMRDELCAAFAEVGDARAVVLRGEGPAFCAGADLAWMRETGLQTHDENLADALALGALFDAVATCPAPVVCLVQGSAFGGGVGLVACADVAFATPEAIFSFSETRLGLIPAVISPHVIAAIGARAARRYLVSGERFDAPTAARIGLVSEVVPGLDDALDRILQELRAAGPEAARHAKRLVLDAPLRPEETARRIAARRASAEGQAGLDAYFERRPPPWA